MNAEPFLLSQPVVVAAGGYRNPWPSANGARSFADLLRWQWERMRKPPPPSPAVSAIPRAIPSVAHPVTAADELRLTWIGQSTFLIQMSGQNILTDPVFSERASPFRWMGPTRFTPPGLPFGGLPPIHVVVLSHDHYDHLDAATVRNLARTHPSAQWLAPLGHADFLRRRGVPRGSIHELSWWETRQFATEAGPLTCSALPAQHWTRRVGSPPNARLWCSWHLAGRWGRVYFTGDSGYCPAFREIAEHMGSCDVALLPIGAYEPRWFMQAAHMNPEDAVQAYLDLRARHFVAMHWATFRLTDEDVLEPPTRLRAAWQRAGLPSQNLHIPAIGQTVHTPLLATPAGEI
jgi:N-acyl-phosphatidylethanolamine-hydrolysing phospholipase D